MYYHQVHDVIWPSIVLKDVYGWILTGHVRILVNTQSYSRQYASSGKMYKFELDEGN